MSGQQSLLGDQPDPRVERAAKALWRRDADRAFYTTPPGERREDMKRLWPRVAKHYREAAEVALVAADAN